MATQTIHAFPQLSRGVLSGLERTDRNVRIPSAAALDLPERAVQFGTGAFLRGFVGSFIDDANARGVFNGRIVAISSTASGRDVAINTQNGLYTLVVQGATASGATDGAGWADVRIVASISRALSAHDEWPAVMECARDPRIGVVFSNTTEIGIMLDEPEMPPRAAPRSFPGKVTLFLYERARAFEFDSRYAPVVIPCELIEDNAHRLREIVYALAMRWRLDPRFMRWLEEVPFCNTLVDRIVTSRAAPRPHDGGAGETRPDHALGYSDELLTFTEPYRLFAIQGDDALRARLAFGSERGVLVAPDILPYRLRKVRILNGSHTLLAPVGLLAEHKTVAEATADSLVGAFQRRVIFGDVVPTLVVPDARQFASDVLDRFANPHIHHALFDITLQGTTKMAVRVIPTVVEHVERFGRIPQALAFGFAAHLLFLRGELHDARRRAGLTIPPDDNGEAIRASWTRARDASQASLRELVADVCGNTMLWEGRDLRRLDGWAPAVTDHLSRMCTHGMRAALRILGES